MNDGVEVRGYQYWSLLRQFRLDIRIRAEVWVDRCGQRYARARHRAKRHGSREDSGRRHVRVAAAGDATSGTDQYSAETFKRLYI